MTAVTALAVAVTVLPDTVLLVPSLLAVVGLPRRDARARWSNPAAPEIVVLELGGVRFIVGASFVQSATDSPDQALLAFVLGLGIGAWCRDVARGVQGGCVPGRRELRREDPWLRAGRLGIRRRGRTPPGQMVTTTLPRACPPPTWRIASAASLRG